MSYKERNEPFHGYRAWRIRGIRNKNPILFSTFIFFPWEGPTVTAHGLPMLNNEFVGIHARSKLITMEELLTDSHSLQTDGMVTGEVDLYGTVVEQERGYRAEHAIVTSINLRFVPCVRLRRFGSITGVVLTRPCPNPVEFWCKSKEMNSEWAGHKSLQTRGLCKEHADLRQPHMEIKELATKLMQRYGCEVIV